MARIGEVQLDLKVRPELVRPLVNARGDDLHTDGRDP